MTLQATITMALNDGKAENLIVLATEKQSCGLFAGMVIATALSARHAKALTERVRQALKLAGYKKRSAVESSDDSDWTLIDCGAIIVHIMQPAARERYQLESLWGFEE